MAVKKRSKHLSQPPQTFPKSTPKRTEPAEPAPAPIIYKYELSNALKKHTPEISNFDSHTISFQVAHDEDTNVEFWAFVDSVSESYTTNFQQTEKLGSPESIYQYTSTSKTLSLSWKAIEDDYEHENPNLQKRIETLKKMVYPDVDKHGIPVKPPLVIMNYGPLKEEYSTNGATETDVFGYISSLSIDYSSQELGHKVIDDLQHPRMVTFTVSFQPINRGKIGNHG